MQTGSTADWQAAPDSTLRALPPWSCPDHGLELRKSSESLVCPAGHSFPLVDCIPRFVPAESYADSFGAQWKRYRLTQLDSHSGTRISEERARRCVGDLLWNRLAGLHVLESGCGAGRFTEVLLGQGAHVTSVDLSAAVDANAENFPQDESHRVAQADIRRLPFMPRQFDLVFCLGVVQHTPAPEETIAALYEHVRPGGILVFDHYSRGLAWRLGTAPLVRSYFRRLPAERALRASERLVDFLLPLHEKAGRLRPLLRRLSPVLSYHDALPQLAPEAQREWALLDTHDLLTDRYKHFRGPASLLRTVHQLGAVDVTAREAGNGVEVRAQRPPES